MAIIQVTTTADSGVGSLRDAVFEAESGDEIRFSLPNNSVITLTSGEIAIPEAKDLTIDGGDVTNLSISGNNASRIFNLKSNSSSVNQFTLKNLTLANGTATSQLNPDNSHTDPSQRGGAIVVSGSASTLTVDNVTFNDNSASRGGGAIYSSTDTKLIVLNSQFNRNNGQGSNEERAGGAITFRGPDELIVKNSEFIDNTGVNGGAINTVHGKLTIENSQFINNTSDGVYDPSQPSTNPGNPQTDSGKVRGYGGAVYVDSAHESTLETTGYIRIYGSVFEGNQGKGNGGAAYLYTIPGDQVIIDSSSFKNNQISALTLKPGATLPPGYVLAPGNGGAINQTSDADIGANENFSVTNSTFANNTATSQGGGIWKNVSPTSIINNTFVGNRAEDLSNPTSTSVIGGGLALYGPATLTNNTIANNFAKFIGGGLAADSATGVTVNNTIFYNNVADRGGSTTKTGAHTNRLLTNGQNNIQFPDRTLASTDFLAVVGIQVIDPLLGPLQNNGGPTETMEPLPGSPAIDTGANIGTLVTDQRGSIRPADGDGNGTSIRDIGALEVTTSILTPEVEATLQGTTLTDGNMTAFDFGQTAKSTPINRTLTISNTGTGVLSLDGLQLPTGFSVVGSIPSSLAAGSQTSVTIQLSAIDSGQYGGEVIFLTNDSTERSFSFAVKGSVTATMNGTAGADSLPGAATDEAINALDGNDTIQANGGNDTVNAGNGNDVIAGGVGLNSLNGGAGNDSYTLLNPLDVIVEASSSTTEVDIINIARNYTLGTNVENLGLLGTKNYNGTGNSLKNLLTGNSGQNILAGNVGDDHLRGMEGNDSLLGGEGNDIVDGGIGTDTLAGGIGNDTYRVDNAGDILSETSSLSTEIDRVESSVDFSLVSNLEFVTLTGGVAITAIGNTLNNSLLGNGLNNSLSGGSGNDTLDGSTGEDSLEGGLGNDTYMIADSSDVIIETSTLTTEQDTVRASLNYTLGVGNVENLTLIGTATTGEGNNLNNIINGSALNNTLSGGGGNDTILDSLGGNDSLEGGDGNDNLNPGAGNDTLAGGDGNDIYQVDSVGDVVSETSTLVSELDNVISTISYSLGANLNLLTLTGTANIDGTGNELSNTITGNAGTNVLSGGAGNDNITGGDGNDTITGGAGNDTITGGAGNDTFNFSSPSERRDQILDFSPGVDVITVSGSGFGGGTIPAGPLFTTRLAFGTVATNANAQFIYDDTNTGNLLFDSDGTGPLASELFAILTTKPSITSSNIRVINEATTITYSVAPVTASINEGASSTTTPVAIVVSRTGAISNSSAIQYNLGGSAVIGFDYQLVDVTGTGITTGPNLITFAAGATVATVNLNILGDATYEPNDLINLTISNPNPTSGSIAVPISTTTIFNDDPTPQITVQNVTVTEGNSGTTNANFAVRLSNASSQTITVNFATADVTTTAGSDYTATSGTVTFSPGQLSRTISIPVIGDTNVEAPQETFNFNLTTPTNATITTPTATGFINNDDHLPINYVIAATSATIPEGAAPNTVLDTFVITRSNYTGLTSSIRYTLGGTASLGTDYELFSITGDGVTEATGRITFAVGATTATLTLRVFGDNVYETNENLSITLSVPSPATGVINTASATSVIQNDDPLPAIASSNITFLEGDTGTNATFTVTLPNPSYQTITVNYATANGTAIAGSDYSTTSGILTFASGQTTQTFNVSIIGDTNIESQETFLVNFTNPTNATLANTSVTGFINDDDGIQPIDYSIVANTVSVLEGSAGNTTPITFVVTRSSFTGTTSSVGYVFTNSTAAQNFDFNLVGVTGTGVTSTSARITFATGASLATITLNVTGDSLVEPDEHLVVTLSNTDTPGATISIPNATTNIVNDDTVNTLNYSIAATTASVTEGPAGNTTPISFVVTRSGSLNLVSSIRYAFTGSVAAQNSDYTLAGVTGTGITENSGRITFASGSSLATINLNVTGDHFFEPDEGILVTLSTPDTANTTITTPSATTTILNDDFANANYGIVATTASITEGGPGNTTPITFVISRTGAIFGISSIRYAFTGSVAAQNADFVVVGATGTGITENSGRVTFAAGASLATVTLNVTGDSTVEPDEDLIVTLTTPSNSADTLNPISATTKVLNDDGLVGINYAISATTSSVLEGAAGNTTPITFVVTRTGALTGTSSIGYGFPTSVATQNSDFVVAGVTGTGITENSGRITFASGASLATITLNVSGDSTVEPDENLIVSLTSPSNGSDTISTATGTTTIVNDDVITGLQYDISATTASIMEGAAGNTTPISFVVTRSGSVNLTGSIRYSFTGSLAAQNSDYTLAGVTGTGITENSGRITFASGASLATINLNVTGDHFFEPDEGILVTLSNPDTANTTITTPSATTTIVNDDFANANYGITATTANITEGGPGNTSPITFVISRTGAIYGISSIRYAFTGSVAAQNSDFVVVGATGTGITENSGRVTFAAGASLATVTLNVTGDSTVEPDEDLIVTLTTPSNSADTLNPLSATTKVLNDDGLTSLNYGITANTASLIEGASPNTVPISFVVTRSGSLNVTGSILYSFSGTAALNSDYTLVGVTGTGITENSGRITFASGATSATITLNVTGDSTVEPDENITLTISSPDTTNTTISNTSASTIISNDDFATINYAIAANTASVTEGATGNTTPITFVVTRTGTITSASSVRYGFPTSVAAQNFDFTVGSVTGTGITESSGRITFAAGASLATVTLNITGDSTYELDENLIVTLSSPSNSSHSLIPASATTVILNDEPLPTVKVNALNLVEGNSGTTMANFVVYLNYTSPQALTVDFATANGTATDGADYTGTSGTITFSPGQSSRTIAVPVIGETLYESNEIFTFNLSNAINATVGTSSVNATITNDDLTLVGTSGADSLVAGAENNTLIGNGGADTLTGGPGNDHYVYNSLSDGGDIITDFRVGQDKINLNALLTSIGYAGSNPIADGYLSFASGTPTSTTNIRIDSDGSAGPSTPVQYIACQSVFITDLNNVNNFIF